MGSGGNGIATSILNEIFSGQNAKWGQSALINTLNTMNAANQTGLGLSLPAYDQNLTNLYNNSGLSTNALNSPVGGLLAQQQGINDARGGLNLGQFQQGGLQGNIGDVLNWVANNQAGQTAQGIQGLQSGNDAYTNILGNNGMANPAYQQGLLDQLSSLSNGGGNNQLLINAANQSLNNQGLNGYDSALQSMGNYILQRGGYDSNLNNLASAGSALLQNQYGTPGLSATGAQAQGAALGGIQRGGETPTLQALQSTGLGLAQQPAIAPTALIAGFAKDQAGQQAQNAARDFQAQALARGGGPGSVVANGAQNAGLADFANNIQQAQSNAFQNALTQQQGLNLQQQGQGAQMALGAGNVAAGQLGTYGNLFNNIGSNANTTYGIGGNLLNNAAQTANQTAGTYGNLGVAGGQLGNQTLGIGTGAANNAVANQIGAGQLLNGMSASQIQALLGAGSGLSTNTSIGNTNYNNLVGNQLASGSLGNTQANSYYNQLGNLLGLGNSAQQNALNLNNNTTGGLNSLLENYLNYARTGLSGQAGLFTQYASNALNNNQAAWNDLNNATGPNGSLSGL